MTEEIKILFDERKVIVSSQVLEKIKYLTREDDVYSDSKNPLSLEMKTQVFFERMESII